MNKIMRQPCVTLGIDRRVSTAYHARCEGTAESHVKKVKHHLKRPAGNKESRWSDNTSVLMNVWNVWKSALTVRNADHEMPSFRDFCDGLVLRIVEELSLYCICLIR